MCATNEAATARATPMPTFSHFIRLPCSAERWRGVFDDRLLWCRETLEGGNCAQGAGRGQSLLSAITLFVQLKTRGPRRRAFNYHYPRLDLQAAKPVRHAAGVLDAHRHLVAGMVDHHPAYPVPVADPDLELLARFLTLLGQGGARFCCMAGARLHH